MIVHKKGGNAMHSDMEAIRCSIMRGGTSKAVFFLENDLPKEQSLRDKAILAAFGSPDVRQIDGLGGADTLTSKVAIIGPSTREDCDVDYTFGQVSYVEPFVDYKGNCGNISSAVGPFAIDAGLVPAVEPVTTVRIHLTNTDNVIVAEVPVKDGRARTEGDFTIDGVPGTGARIVLDFCDTQGALTGSLLPTGRVKDMMHFDDGEEYEVSLVDAGNPLVFISAHSLGMTGTETPAEIDANQLLMEKIEKIRARAAVIFGLVEKEEDAALKSPYIPFFAIVSKPADYICYNGRNVSEEEVDVVSRLLFMLKSHKTYPGTGTCCTGAAARIPGTVLWDQLTEDAKNRTILRIGHPAGIIEVEAAAEEREGTLVLTRDAFYRTARKIMDGIVYIRKQALENF